MRTLVICPGVPHGVEYLGQAQPLVLRAIAGKTVLEHWLEHLADTGTREVILITSDRPHQIHGAVEDGARWGMGVTIQVVDRELTVEQARQQFPAERVVRLDHLPGMPAHPLFNSYIGWFAAVLAWVPRVGLLPGWREWRQGIWLGPGTRVARTAVLRAPCWLGQQVWVGGRAVVGPMAVLEDHTHVDPRAEVAYSIVGPATFVGRFTEVRDSIVDGSRLLSWRTESCTLVPDPFLLSSLRVGPPRPRSWSPLRELLQRLVPRCNDVARDEPHRAEGPQPRSHREGVLPG